jgi:threonylcarbamoyladenosine tRNA methylthiotransferase MtaB
VRIYVSSLGCKLNQSEMDSLAGRLTGLGYQVVASPAEADLCVLNTCAVTHVAAQKSRQTLRRMHRENPGARLVATGCYAELEPGDLRGLPGVELVAGNQDKDRLEELLGADGIQPAPIITAPAPHDSRLTCPRTRAFVKIQDGCDNACAYCVIRLARGPQRSRPPDQVLAEVEARLAAGHQEIVLTGVHIGAYGRDRGDASLGVDLWALVRRLLADTDVPRLRLSSIEPWDLPQRAFDLWRDPRLCRHLHLPLQSGSDAVLRRMARRYTTAEFAALVEAARSAIPGLAVTTDVIVGFPGETEAEHAQSLDFVQATRFSRVHVFPYSLRPGTLAAKMPGQVPSQIKAGRARAMRAIAAASGLAFRQQFAGQRLDVLWESARKEGSDLVWSGLTDNYLRVYAISEEKLANQLLPTQLVGLFKDGLRGQVRI